MKRPAAPGKRILIVSAFIAGVYLLLFGRIVFLQTVRASEFRAKASEAHKTEDKLKPIRGRILDCNGIVLARTIEESTVTLYPVKIANTALAAEIVSRHTGIPEQRVRVVMRDTGGGFGQKVIPMREDMCILLAARKVPGPLKWIEDRLEHLMAATAATNRMITLRAAVTADSGTR